jgi:hypothetical protein
MKKFFVALLVLALAASNVFAEVTFSGGFFGTWDIVSGEGGKDGEGGTVADADTLLKTKLGLSDDLIRTRLQVTATNEEGTWGGWLRIQPSAPTPTQGRLWWQPITQIKMYLGATDIGRPFGQLGNLDVNDYLNAKNAGSVADIFPGIDAEQGFALLLTPIANLKIGVSTPIVAAEKIANLGWDFDGDGKVDTSSNPVKQPAEVSYRRIGAWVGYTLDGIGTFGLGFKGSSTDYVDGDHYGQTHLADAKSKLAFGFDLTAIENLQLQIGAAYPLPADIDGDVDTIDSRQNPITIGLRADYTVESSFGVRALLGVALGGKTTYKVGDADEDSFILGVTLTPWVNVGVGNIGLSLSLKSTGASKTAGADDMNDHLDFEVTPYFSKSYGGGAFFAGFRLGFSNYFDEKYVDDESGKVTWAVPVGLSYSF